MDMVAFAPLEELRKTFLDLYVLMTGFDEDLVLKKAKDHSEVGKIGLPPKGLANGVRQICQSGYGIELMLSDYRIGSTDQASKQIHAILVMACAAYAKQHREQLERIDTHLTTLLKMYGEQTARKRGWELSMQPLEAAFVCWVIETRKR